MQALIVFAVHPPPRAIDASRSPLSQIGHDPVITAVARGRKANRGHAADYRHRGNHDRPSAAFFQQSYVIDKRITPRFMRSERADL
jgi:hypothetical protein